MVKTIENLAKAFLGESQARNRYDMYAKIAVKEGYQSIADNFFLTATQEQEHAKWLMRMINELKGENKDLDKMMTNEVEVVTVLSDTKENLKSAIAGEDYETNSMYPEFADVAEEEGYPEIAKRLRAIAKAEANHEDRFKKLLDLLESGKMFSSDEEVVWVCKKCGYIHTSKDAPEECPSCGHPQAYFSIKK